MYVSRYMPCSECGASVDRAARGQHVCDPERLLDYRLFELREELDELEAEIVGYLQSPDGRFAAWEAERRRTAE
jgi:hypothetical protein